MTTIAHCRRIYWAVLNDLGIGDDEALRHKVNLDCIGVASTKGLTLKQWQELVKALREFQKRSKRATRQPFPEPVPAELTGAATPEQLEFLLDLIRDIEWRKPDGWRGFIIKACRMTDNERRAWVSVGGALDFLSREQASKAIRRMTKERRLQRQRRAAAALDPEPVPF